MHKLLTSIIFLGIVSQLPAQTNVNLADIELRYLQLLNESTNVSIIESALYCVTEMKILHPELDFDAINNRVIELSLSDSNNEVRSKANITNLYLCNADLAKQLAPVDYWDGPEFWSMLEINLNRYNDSTRYYSSGGEPQQPWQIYLRYQGL